MRFLHTSDLHIGSPLTARLSPLKAKERKRELIETFRQTVAEAVNAGVIGYIIAGDLFDSEKVGVRTVDSTLAIMAAAKNTAFFYLPGNHEKDRLLKEKSLPNNLYVFDDEWKTYRIGNVAITGRTTVKKDMFDSLSLPEDARNILVLHGDIGEKTDDSGVIGTYELQRLPVDYIALGHYHSYREIPLNNSLSAVYSGTPEGRGFDEVGEKGYVLLDIESSTTSHRFIGRNKRTVRIVEVALDNIETERELEERVERGIYGIPSTDLVRVVLTGYAVPTLIRDTGALVQRFSDRFYAFEVKDEGKLFISADKYKNDRSLKGEFIRLVMSKDELSDDEKQKIINCGLLALMGEE